jgi:hypothetical protein
LQYRNKPQSASGGGAKQNDAAAVPSTLIAGAMNRPLSASAFGCFQRINFCFGFIGFNDQMGGQVAIAEESSVPRLQPLHCSTIWLQIPPL